MASRRAAAYAVVLSVVVGTVAIADSPAARAQEGGSPDELPEWAEALGEPGQQPSPEAPPVPDVESAAPIESVGVDPAVAELPGPGVADVTLGEQGQRHEAGDLPIRVAAGSANAAHKAIRVEVLDRDAARRAGASGFVARITGPPGGPLDADALEITIDYERFAQAYGASYAERLQVVALPACALAASRPEGCVAQGVPLAARRDAEAQELTVDLADVAGLAASDLAVGGEPTEAERGAAAEPTEAQPGATTEPTQPERGAAAEPTEAQPEPGADTQQAQPEPGTTTGRADAGVQGAVVLALASGTTGDDGSFRATPLASSSDWQVGLGSGNFAWSYPVPVPAAPAGPPPTVTLGYSSGSIDGLTTTKNTQAGPVGLGFGDFANAFVERRYITCSDDTFPRNILDFCWQSDNAVLSLNGRSAELIPVNRTAPPTAPKEWRMASDPTWKVEQVFGAAGDPANGDDDKEWWKVTSRDGTEFWFGRGYNPDTPSQVTNSVFWAPVVGNQTGEPCSVNICNQGWRWNLDRVVDPNGNITTYTYAVEMNKYVAVGGLGGERSYVRAGQVATIEYGAHTGPTVAAQAKVEFGLQWRCASLSPACTEPRTGADGTQYPDVPVDLICVENTAACANFAPSFFTARRYSQVRTYVNDAGWKAVDEFALAHSYDPNNDPAVKDKLTLTGVQRKGVSATPNITLPATTFAYTKLDNRVASATNPATLPHYRVTQVNDEFGRKISVTYGHQAGHGCTTDQVPSGGWENNTKECFRQQWVPDGDPAPPAQTGVFHKWLVKEVKVEDTTTGSPAMTTTYAYEGDPAWHFDTDRFIHTSNQGWEDWRGYGTVLTTQGASRARYRVLRGMHGDRANSSGGLRTVDVPSLDDPALTHRDWNWLAGATFDEAQLSSGASPVTLVGTVHTYKTVTTVDDDANAGNEPHAEKAAVWTAEETNTRRDRRHDGSYARRRTTTTYNPLVLWPETVEESGWLDQTGDERCSRTSYVINVAEWMLDFPASERLVSGMCAATNGTELRMVEIAYDGGAYGAAPTKGNVTKARQKLTATPTWTETTTAYDGLGRSVSETDALGRRTTTSYTPATGNARVVTTTALAHLADASKRHVTVVNQLLVRGVPTKQTDPNGNVTTFGYDALGRSTSVKLPTEQAAGEPNSWEFVYTIDPNKAKPPVVRTRQLQSAGTSPVYIESWQVYDSLLRERQTHRLSPEAGKTIVVHTDYDDRGLAASVSSPQAVPGVAGSGMLMPSGSPTPWENRTATVYDELSRPFWAIFLARPPGQPETYQWSTVSAYTYNTTKVTRDRGGAVTTTVDAYGRSIQVDEESTRGSTANVATTRYTYDAADRMTGTQDPDGHQTGYVYDLGGRRIFALDGDVGFWGYGYDAVGNQTSATDARGITTYVKYDDLDRQIERRQDNPTTGRLLASWAYDAPGQKGLLDQSVSFHTRPNGEGDEAYITDIGDYDQRSRPTSTTYIVFADRGGLFGAYTFGYGYDRADHRTSTTYPEIQDANGEVLPEETLTAEYNSLGLATKLDSSLLPATDDAYLNFAMYDNRARAAWFNLGQSAGGVYKFWAYDATQRLTGTATYAAVQTPGQTKLQDRTVAYDQTQNIVSRTTTLGGKSWVDCYGYDDRNRLTRAYSTSHEDACAATAAGGGDAPLDQSYSYSPAGNLTQRITSVNTSNPITYDYSYAHPADAVRKPPHAPAGIDSEVSGEDVTYRWDQNGQLTERRRSTGDYDTFVWTADRRLDRIQDPNGNVKDAYAYGADGDRVLREAVDRTTFYVEGHEVSATNGGAVTVVRTYSVDGQRIATRTAAKADSDSLPTNALEYLVQDNQGSVEMTIKAGENTPAAQRTYTPYGTDVGGEFQTDRGWVGEIEDDRTGLNYLNARYYDPYLSRFISADPLFFRDQPQTLNPYAYGLNSPTVYIDPSGLCGWGDPWNCGDELVEAADDLWDETGGRVVAEVNDCLVESGDDCNIDDDIQEAAGATWDATGGAIIAEVNDCLVENGDDCNIDDDIQHVAGQVAAAVDVAYDWTVDRIEQAWNYCTGSWQGGATCIAVAAGVVSLGAGGLALAGFGGGLAGTMGTVATTATWVGTGAQALLTIDDCSKGIDASCFVNAAATALGPVSISTGGNASTLQTALRGAPQHMLGEGAHFIDPGGAHFAAGLAQAAGWQSLTASAGSFVLGFPGVSTFADSR